ncbi:acyl-CoA thioester hydrolase [Halobacillus karajensis]|uniref:Acyl-CoA thioester hydrolase, YbgC/YbaW family n=1 Tax=Halobacillus karajensis TaxID=195088 RepID=A0A024P6Q8_9BACI|nr:acyl-CoA thioesterase [Halobacillus karajensis]CDQ20499.1 acyl-CoA thioester hydrolase, YbgC/YbaW family [Halobacillus karajensis]CDQ24032.1 acyl-CoA thioester hydrolase, YbgC/YbaW family [Halobacillus karajensis]CDQ27510.1 acyl-CoA thioester hydrolase, YbgC/YbaW family [Halobacillus karajensis]SEH90828.1 acyl-CoA thioester hydrolase [Halobacillus karajensis]
MHEIEVNVRFCETDLLGHVNNNNFFIYMEDARIRFFKDLDLVGEDWNFIVASTKCDFIKQVYFNQTLRICSHVVKVGRSSFHLEQEMFEKETGELVARGLSVIVQFDFEKQKSVALTPDMKKSLSSYQMAAN